MRIIKKTLLGLAFLLLPLALSAHVDNFLLPEGCGSCHVGHGKPNEPMLDASEENSCYHCHGNDSERSMMKAVGKLAAIANPVDIKTEFEKQYHHPVEASFEHSPTEQLPSADRATVSHAECVDCHNPHQRITAGPKQVTEVSGFSLSGQYLESSVNEYEICLKCHVGNSSAGSESNISYDFAPTVRSQHPVTKITNARKSVSTSSGPAFGGKMKCSDCHTSDNPNGPRGPHGSNYPYLLSGNYVTDIDGDEGPFVYQFCYSCHDRSSILSNESFSLHREHIVGDPIKGIKGTSCYTCHASHSSQRFEHLMSFNPEAVSADKLTGRILYLKTGESSGECYLTCHGQEHSPGRY